VTVSFVKVSFFDCGPWTCGRILNTLHVALLQSNVGSWACGRIGKGQLFLCNYLSLVAGCGLVGGSQIVEQKETVLHWMWFCCTAMWASVLVGRLERDS
jgi:hypothetical protein